MNKAELIEKAKELGIALNGDETNAALEELIANHKPDPEGEKGQPKEPAPASLSRGPNIAAAPTEAEEKAGPVLARRSLNRGSNRRLIAASVALEKACNDFVAAIDPHVFLTDDNGKRVGEWPVLEGVRRFKQAVHDEVNALLPGHGTPDLPQQRELATTPRR